MPQPKRILDMASIADVRDLYAYPGLGDIITSEEVTHVLKLCGAFWMHSGNAAHPHAELTSGKCSDGFVNVMNALCYPNLCKMFGRQMAILASNKVRELKCPPPAWVVGSDHASATLSFAVASALLRAKHDFTEKDPTPGSKKQLWKRFVVQPTEGILQVEEIVTTHLTMDAVRQGIVDGNPYDPLFTPFVMTLVNRSGSDDFHGFPILSLASYDINSWEPADCPLCNQGSKRLKPKANWDELTQPS